jgi:hypothetical protein
MKCELIGTVMNGQSGGTVNSVSIHSKSFFCFLNVGKKIWSKFRIGQKLKITIETIP